MSMSQALQYSGWFVDGVNFRLLWHASNKSYREMFWLSNTVYRRAIFECFHGFGPRNDGFVKVREWCSFDDAHVLFYLFVWKGWRFSGGHPVNTDTFFGLFRINAGWLFNGPFSTSHDFLIRSKTVLKPLQTPFLFCTIQNEPSPPLEGSCDIEIGPWPR